MWARAVIHADLDAFYASVEQKRHPELRGKPVIVGGGHDEAGNAVIARGVVSAASYEARQFGVHSAMPLREALRRCPHAVLRPVDFVAYRAESSAVFDVFATYTPQIEPLSLDEAFLDVTHSQRRFGDAVAIAQAMRDEIFERTELHASFGVATCKVVAKIASDLRKPRGFVVVAPGEEAATLAPLPLRRLPGLGPATEKALAGLGVTTLGELAALPPEVISRRVGAHHGRALWERAQGIDASEVTIPEQPKSVSREQTFDVDIASADQLYSRLRSLAANVGGRLRAQSLCGRTITLKLRYADFSTLTRQHSLDAATDSDVAIANCAVELFTAHWSTAPVRLLGVGVSGFVEAAQLDVFSDAAVGSSRQRSLDKAMDALRGRFGDAAVQRGTDALKDLDFRGEDLRQRARE